MKLFIGLLLLVSSACGWDHMYIDYNTLLQKHVSNGLVHYKLIKQNPKLLTDYIQKIEKLTRDEYNKFTDEQKIAFWINSYNAYTIKLIIDSYPLKSIKDIKDPWDQKVAVIFKKETSLNFMEHQILRKEFNEPRIHFALVCAAISCPILQNAAYIPKKLESQLKEAALIFLKDTTSNKIKPENDTIYLSKLFKWYGEDFVKTEGSLISYIGKVADVNYKSTIKIKYLNYDWNLNEHN